MDPPENTPESNTQANHSPLQITQQATNNVFHSTGPSNGNTNVNPNTVLIINNNDESPINPANVASPTPNNNRAYTVGTSSITTATPTPPHREMSEATPVNTATTSDPEKNKDFFYTTVGKFATLNVHHELDNEIAYAIKNNGRGLYTLLCSHKRVRILAKVGGAEKHTKRKTAALNETTNLVFVEKGYEGNTSQARFTSSPIPFGPAMNLKAFIDENLSKESSNLKTSIEQLSDGDYVVIKALSKQINCQRLVGSAVDMQSTTSTEPQPDLYHVFTLKQVNKIINSFASKVKYGNKFDKDGVVIVSRKVMDELYPQIDAINVEESFANLSAVDAFKNCCYETSPAARLDLLPKILAGLPESFVRSFFIYEFFEGAFEIDAEVKPCKTEGIVSKVSMTYRFVNMARMHNRVNRYAQKKVEDGEMHYKSYVIKDVRTFRKRVLALHYNAQLYLERIDNRSGVSAEIIENSDTIRKYLDVLNNVKKKYKNYKNNNQAKVNSDMSSIHNDAMRTEFIRVSEILKDHRDREDVALKNEWSSPLKKLKLLDEERSKQYAKMEQKTSEKFGEMIQNQNQMKDEQIRVKEDQSQMKEDLTSLKENVASLKENVASMNENITFLKDILIRQFNPNHDQ